MGEYRLNVSLFGRDFSSLNTITLSVFGRYSLLQLWANSSSLVHPFADCLSLGFGVAVELIRGVGA